MYNLKKIFHVFLILTIIHVAYSLNCYLCVGPAKGGCATGNLKDVIKQKCDSNKLSTFSDITRFEENEFHIPIKTSCVQFIATDRKTNVTVYERSCGSVPKRWNVCKFLQHFVQVKNCTECQNDYCNNKPLNEF